MHCTLRKHTCQLTYKWNMQTEYISQPDTLICHPLTWINSTVCAPRMTSLETAKHIQEDTPNSHMWFSGELNSKWQSTLTRYKKIIFYEQISQLEYFGHVKWFRFSDPLGSSMVSACMQACMCAYSVLFKLVRTVSLKVSNNGKGVLNCYH